MTGSGQLIEIQGAAEGATVSWQQFDEVRDLAIIGIDKLITECNRLFDNIVSKKKKSSSINNSLFSLQNRQL